MTSVKDDTKGHLTRSKVTRSSSPKHGRCRKGTIMRKIKLKNNREIYYTEVTHYLCLVDLLSAACYLAHKKKLPSSRKEFEKLVKGYAENRGYKVFGMMLSKFKDHARSAIHFLRYHYPDAEFHNSELEIMESLGVISPQKLIEV